MQPPLAPNAGLSDSENRIATAVLQQLSGPLHLMIETKINEFNSVCAERIQCAVDAAVVRGLAGIDAVVHEAIQRVLRNSSSSGSGNSSGSFEADGTAESILFNCSSQA